MNTHKKSHTHLVSCGRHNILLQYGEDHKLKYSTRKKAHHIIIYNSIQDGQVSFRGWYIGLCGPDQ